MAFDGGLRWHLWARLADPMWYAILRGMSSMGRWRFWPMIGLIVVVGIAGAVLVAFAVARNRGLVGDVVQTVTSVLALTGGIVLWLWTRSRRDVPTPVDALARAGDALAAAV
ncbi:MAG: hypothetical protein LC775_06615, partial [Acidobacteria bacterium]|nr:hypothetical protein [Acidobacteriota bacterium]